MSKIFPHRNRKLRPAGQWAPVVIEDPIAHRQRVEAERAERERIEAERQRRRAAVRERKTRDEHCISRLDEEAKRLFPWDKLKAEIIVFNAVVRSGAETTLAQRFRTRTALFAIRNVFFSSRGRETASAFFSSGIDRETWEIIENISPITTSQKHVSRLVNFLNHGYPPGTELLLEQTAEASRIKIAEHLEAARDDKAFVTCCSIGDGWFLTRTERADRMIWQKLREPFGSPSYEAAIKVGEALGTKLEMKKRDAAFGAWTPESGVDLAFRPPSKAKEKRTNSE